MSRESTARLNTLWGRLLVEELARCGVTFVCISPGSRSTPLTAAVAAAGRRIASAVWLDERGAAFHALGRARADGRPAALICTSGTAVANYLPAVIEAAQDGVPLVVVTADRPPELIDAGANQAIRQPGIFGDYVRWSFTLPAPDADISCRLVLSTVDQALHRALGPPAGPVHINCMFREPLEPAGEQPWPDDISRRWREGSDPLTVYARPETIPDAASLERIAATVVAAQRGLVLIGSISREDDRDAAAALARRLGWPVAADIRSGLRLGPGPANRVPFLDQILLSPRVRATFAPDVVLHLGGQPISKRLGQALAALPDATVISVREHPFRDDPEHQVAHRVQADIGRFCELLEARIAGGEASASRDREKSSRAHAAGSGEESPRSHAACPEIAIDIRNAGASPATHEGPYPMVAQAFLPVRTDRNVCHTGMNILADRANVVEKYSTDITSAPCGWGDQLRALSARAEECIAAFVAAAPFGEIAAARIVSREIPAGHGLFLGNSMPIRDMEMFACTSGPRPPVAANRGASGIDGIVSTAAGFACGLGRPATLMIGDLSLLHDLTALVQLRALPQPLIIVVLNNGGGGIFHFLPIARQPDLLDPWFTAPHDVDFAGIQRLFGIPCHRPASAAEFTAVYRAACAGDAPAIIEVRTDRAENLAAHRALGAAIVAAIEDAAADNS